MAIIYDKLIELTRKLRTEALERSHNVTNIYINIEIFFFHQNDGFPSVFSLMLDILSLDLTITKRLAEAWIVTIVLSRMT